MENVEIMECPFQLTNAEDCETHLWRLQNVDFLIHHQQLRVVIIPTLQCVLVMVGNHPLTTPN